MSAKTNVPTRALSSDQRHQQILARLRAAGRIDAAEIATELSVTGETIRKDLILLERNGLLRRVHGGATLVEALSFEPAVSTRQEFAVEKNHIAAAAVKHLPKEGSILLDAGSTTARLADLIPPESRLTVYTNALPIALSLANRPRLTIYTLGGRLRSVTQGEVDEWALRALAEINVEVAFLGTNGLSLTRGLTTPDPAEAAVKRAMLHCARTRILLADHSKVGEIRGSQHAVIDDIDLFITDSGLSDTDAAAIRAEGLKVEIA